MFFATVTYIIFLHRNTNRKIKIYEKINEHGNSACNSNYTSSLFG